MRRPVSRSAGGAPSVGYRVFTLASPRSAARLQPSIIVQQVSCKLSSHVCGRRAGRGTICVGRFLQVSRLVHSRGRQARSVGSRTGQKLRLHPPGRAGARPVDERVPLSDGSDAGMGVLDRYRLHLVLLAAAVRAQAHQEPATGGLAVGRDPGLRVAVRRLSLRRRELAVPALADHQPPARLLLSVRPARPGDGTVHVQPARVLRRLHSLRIPRTRALVDAGDARLDLDHVGNRLHVVDGGLLREHDRHALGSRARDRAPSDHGRAAAAHEGTRREGEPRQVDLPGQDEPRAENAAQRGHRL